MSLFSILNIAGSAMSVQSKKMNVHANNLANVESMIHKNGKFYPYIAKQVILQPNTYSGKNINGVRIDKIVDDPSPCRLVYSPNNPMANKKGYIRMSNVNIIKEMINSISAARSYQANTEIINTVKFMIMKTLNIGQ